MKLDKKMINDATMHAADVSRDIDLPTLIFGILTKKILPYSTVLGFSRSGDFLNRDLLKGKAKVSIVFIVKHILPQNQFFLCICVTSTVTNHTKKETEISTTNASKKKNMGEKNKQVKRREYFLAVKHTRQGVAQV